MTETKRSKSTILIPIRVDNNEYKLGKNHKITREWNVVKKITKIYNILEW